MPPLAKGTIEPADPNRPPNNPFYLKAVALAKKKDKAGLRALDKELAAAGYAATGQTRKLIADSLGG